MIPSVSSGFVGDVCPIPAERTAFVAAATTLNAKLSSASLSPAELSGVAEINETVKYLVMTHDAWITVKNWMV